MRYTIARDLVAENVADELVLTLPSGDLVVLNESAQSALEALKDCPEDPESAIAQALVDAYGINGPRARHDAHMVLSRLRREHVIEPVRLPRPRSQTPYRRITRKTFVAGMAAAGLSLLASPRALGEEASAVAKKVYTGGNLATIGESGGHRLWTDSLGRSVQVPEHIEKVVPYGPFAQSLMESIDEDMIVQASPRGLQASVVDRRDSLARELRAQTGNGIALSEYELESQSPDIVLDVAVNERTLVTSIDAQADETGVPIVHMAVKPGNLPQAYRTLGRLLNKEDRCNELADYVGSIEVTLAQVREQVPRAARKRVYFGQGYCGLETRGAETLADDVFNTIALENVFLDNTGVFEVEPPDVYEAKPDVIVLFMPGYEEEEMRFELTRAIWGRTRVGKGKQVLLVPEEPFDWFGASPLAMQTLGALWLASAVYPKLFEGSRKNLLADCLKSIFGISGTKWLPALLEKSEHLWKED